jgi:hypothetical protein
MLCIIRLLIMDLLKQFDCSRIPVKEKTQEHSPGANSFSKGQDYSWQISIIVHI